MNDMGEGAGDIDEDFDFPLRDHRIRTGLLE